MTHIDMSQSGLIFARKDITPSPHNDAQCIIRGLVDLWKQTMWIRKFVLTNLTQISCTVRHFAIGSLWRIRLKQILR